MRGYSNKCKRLERFVIEATSYIEAFDGVHLIEPSTSVSKHVSWFKPLPSWVMSIMTQRGGKSCKKWGWVLAFIMISACFCLQVVVPLTQRYQWNWHKS